MENILEQFVIRPMPDGTFKATRAEPWRLHIDQALERAARILKFSPLPDKKDVPHKWPFRWASVIPEDVTEELFNPAECARLTSMFTIHQREPFEGRGDEQTVFFSGWQTAHKCMYNIRLLRIENPEGRPIEHHLGILFLTFHGLIFNCEYAIESNPRPGDPPFNPQGDTLLRVNKTRDFACSVLKFARCVYGQPQLPLRVSLGLRNVLGVQMWFDRLIGPPFPDQEFRSYVEVKSELLQSENPLTLVDPLVTDLRYAFGEPYD